MVLHRSFTWRRSTGVSKHAGIRGSTRGAREPIYQSGGRNPEVEVRNIGARRGSSADAQGGSYERREASNSRADGPASGCRRPVSPADWRVERRVPPDDRRAVVVEAPDRLALPRRRGRELRFPIIKVRCSTMIIVAALVSTATEIHLHSHIFKIALKHIL